MTIPGWTEFAVTPVQTYLKTHIYSEHREKERVAESSKDKLEVRLVSDSATSLAICGLQLGKEACVPTSVLFMEISFLRVMHCFVQQNIHGV